MVESETKRRRSPIQLQPTTSFPPPPITSSAGVLPFRLHHRNSPQNHHQPSPFPFLPPYRISMTSGSLPTVSSVSAFARAQLLPSSLPLSLSLRPSAKAPTPPAGQNWSKGVCRRSLGEGPGGKDVGPRKGGRRQGGWAR